MQAASVYTGITSSNITSSLSANRKPAVPTYGGHPDYEVM